MFKRLFSKKSKLEDLEDEFGEIEPIDEMKQFQEEFTKYFHPFIKRTPYFIENEVRKSIEENNFSWFNQEYPFGTLTLDIENTAKFECAFTHERFNRGELEILITKDLQTEITCKIEGEGNDDFNGFRYLPMSVVEKMEEYPLLLRIAYSLAFYLCERQINVFSGQKDEEMVLYFQNKKIDFEQLLLGM